MWTSTPKASGKMENQLAEQNAETVENRLAQERLKWFRRIHYNCTIITVGQFRRRDERIRKRRVNRTSIEGRAKRARIHAAQGSKSARLASQKERVKRRRLAFLAERAANAMAVVNGKAEEDIEYFPGILRMVSFVHELIDNLIGDLKFLKGEWKSWSEEDMG